MASPLITDAVTRLQDPDEKLKKQYGINDCHVLIPRLSDSILFPSDGSYEKSHQFGNDQLRYLKGQDYFSDTDSDTSTIRLGSDVYKVHEFIEKLDFYPEDHFTNQNDNMEKPFTVHYSPVYLDEIVRNIYNFHATKKTRLNLSQIFKELNTEFSTLSEKNFVAIVRQKLEAIFYAAISEEVKAEYRTAAEKILKHLVKDRVNAVIGCEDNSEPHCVKVTSANCIKLILNRHIMSLKKPHTHYRKLFYDKKNFVIVKEDLAKEARKAIKRVHKLKIEISKEENVLALEHHQRQLPEEAMKRTTGSTVTE